MLLATLPPVDFDGFWQKSPRSSDGNLAHLSSSSTPNDPSVYSRASSTLSEDVVLESTFPRRSILRRTGESTSTRRCDNGGLRRISTGIKFNFVEEVREYEVQNGSKKLAVVDFDDKDVTPEFDPDITRSSRLCSIDENGRSKGSRNTFPTFVGSSIGSRVSVVRFTESGSRDTKDSLSSDEDRVISDGEESTASPGGYPPCGFSTISQELKRCSSQTFKSTSPKDNDLDSGTLSELKPTFGELDEAGIPIQNPVGVCGIFGFSLPSFWSQRNEKDANEWAQPRLVKESWISVENSGVLLDDNDLEPPTIMSSGSCSSRQRGSSNFYKKLHDGLSKELFTNSSQVNFGNIRTSDPFYDMTPA